MARKRAERGRISVLMFLMEKSLGLENKCASWRSRTYVGWGEGNLALCVV